MRRATLATFAGLVALGAAAMSPLAHAAPARPHSPTSVLSAPQMYVTHLRLHVVTTSNITAVNITPGTTAATRLLHQHGSGSWQAQGPGVVLAGGKTTGRKSITEDFIFEDLHTSPHLRLTMQKGDDGATHATLSRVTGNRSATIASLSDTGKTPGKQHVRTKTLTRSSLMGSTPVKLPRSDPRKLVLAFYYPWYPQYQQGLIADHPQDPRSTFTERGVNSMTAQAKANGINGFIVSWAGEQKDGKQFRLALKAAHRNHQVITGYLECAMASTHLLSAQRDLENWLVQLLHYSKQSSFLKTRTGVPVVFVYWMDKFTPSQWRYVLKQVRVKYHERVDLVGDNSTAAYLPFDWGIHRYTAVGPIAPLRNYSLEATLLAKAQSALYPKARKRLYAATVSPGYDDQKERGHLNPIIPRDDGRRYAQTWKAALTGQPDWVLVTSWNEWFEDTEVEPGKKTGSSALTVTRNESRAWKDGTATR